MGSPRLLVACEFSGIVRDAFTARGYDATSCDILESERPGKHYRGDVRDIIHDGWDMMLVFPPCQYLARSGSRWLKTEPDRPAKQEEALAFVLDLMHAPIERIGLENPVGAISAAIRKPDQVIQPWWFGDDASKMTCLWLKNLPPLFETNRLPGDRNTRRANQTEKGYSNAGQSTRRQRDRSRTYPGIANAMAAQWGRFLDI